MRTSCNGCRVLRKGCSDDCVIRPCLQWMKSADAQANATVFLAKFYGRAGLLNLLNAGPDYLRPAIFQSLLYEACGRVVDPIYGSVGLLYSGQWHHCQLAVDSVLKGLPIIQLSPPSDLPSSSSSHHHQVLLPPLKLYDIRHMSSSFPKADPTILPANIINGGNENETENDDDEQSTIEKLSVFSGESTYGSTVAGQTSENGSKLHLELTLGFNKFGEMRY